MGKDYYHHAVNFLNSGGGPRYHYGKLIEEESQQELQKHNKKNFLLKPWIVPQIF